MDPNIQETEPAGRKRRHNEFSDDLAKPSTEEGKRTVLHPGSPDRTPSSASCSPAAGGETQRSSPMLHSTSPQTPSKADSANQPQDGASPISQTTSASKPVIKRARLTPQEREARDKALADKKRERETQAALRAAERAKQDQEKAVRAKEREEKRKKKEEEDRAKSEKKRKREEEQQRAQAEKDKKARSQTKLNNFFASANTPTTVPSDCKSMSVSPTKTKSSDQDSHPLRSAYEQLFKPFFVRPGTRWAESIVQMDQETREHRSRMLDEFISGRQAVKDVPAAPNAKSHFDAKELLGLSPDKSKRGLRHHPVRHIMEAAGKDTSSMDSARGAAPDNALEDAKTKLAKIPIKVISFREDVRPAYCGTITLKPHALGQQGMYKQARRSHYRRLPLDYDYDSEAEWQDEEGEDVDIDDDDDDQEDDDDMDGFLDDSEDAGVARRVFANTMEPECSGILFEKHPGDSEGMLNEYRMEFIHAVSGGIDPWSEQYWEPEAKKKTSKGEQASKMAPPPARANALEAIQNGTGREAPRLVKTELWGDVTRVILGHKALSKGSIIDIAFHELRHKASRAEVKNTIELIAEKTGQGRSKEWDIKPKYKELAGV